MDWLSVLNDSDTCVNYELQRYSKLECPDLGHLLDVAEAERHSFVERTRQEWDAGINRFDQPGEAFFVAIAADQIVGICGLNKDPYLSDPAVGRLRHLYVHPSRRRTGMAQALVARCLSFAPRTFDRVRLRTSNPAADRLYCSMGFAPVGEPTATHEWRFTEPVRD